MSGVGFAADFADVINEAEARRPEGQRVIYEMNVGSFTQSGTFAAAQDRLQELKSLGVDIVWLMPVYPRGGGINSPYAATSFQKTNPKYGTIADLKAFVARAHELQMEVWLDWVPNHTATNAEWVTAHPEYYAKSGGQMIHPNGYGDVWQLDYNNTGLVNAMNDCLKFWIDEADIDGYRCDYISSQRIPTSYWQTTIPMIKSYKAGKSITFLGEADIASDATRLKTAGFDYDYAWQFQSQLADFGTGTASARLKVFINTLLEKSAGLSFGRMLYVTNHDQNYNEEKKTLTQKYGANRYALTVLAYTVYGMPLIYNGQETGGNQALDYFNDTKINWTTKDDKMLNTLRTLFALKHAVPALSDARKAADNPATSMLDVSGSTSVLAYTRTLGDSQVLVVLNVGSTAATATVEGLTAGEWSQWLTSETIAQGTSRHQTTLSASHTFTIDAKGYRVFVRGTYPEQTVGATGISSLPVTATTDERWFDLSGRQIQHPIRQGIYIHGGRKVIIR
jgi:1,4-alpha-glucan branching enzyme